METLLETETYKLPLTYLSEVSTRCTKLIVEAFRKGDQDEVLRRQMERSMVSKVMEHKRHGEGWEG